MSYVHHYRLTILEHHLDTFGHVNNAVYLRLFEEARWDMITDRGYGMEQVLATGLGPVVLDVHVKFRKELRLRETITIETRCIGHRRTLSYLEQRLLNSQGEPSAIAEFTFGFFDKISRKLVTPSPLWLAAIGVEKDAKVDPRSKEAPF